MAFHEKDRITRQIQIGYPERKAGVVKRVYTGRPTGTGRPGPDLYDIQWDNTDHIECGYLDIDLELEAPSVQLIAPTCLSS